ncbi:hypothetical protein HAX54_024866 [Datura stramonium]|uniref:Uncharacterized protein n=1 Tax=Datura stramonium TaxID=4076 RepID=A0ABS8V0L5_DATST|nr:hypothetical protein [Datura stramonium]
MDSAAVRKVPYSGISGSMLIFNFPKHFIDYYALPHLWVPRYPPSYGVEMMGSVHGFSFLFFCRISLKGLKGDSASSCSEGPTLSSSPEISDEGTLGEPPTPTTIHVRSILDLTNCPSYLLYVLDSPSLSQ